MYICLLESCIPIIQKLVFYFFVERLNAKQTFKSNLTVISAWQQREWTHELPRSQVASWLKSRAYCSSSQRTCRPLEVQIHYCWVWWIDQRFCHGFYRLSVTDLNPCADGCWPQTGIISVVDFIHINDIWMKFCRNSGKSFSIPTMYPTNKGNWNQIDAFQKLY